MDKEIIYRFFADQTSYAEEERLKQWLEESDENRKLFLKERAVFDSILFLDETKELPKASANKGSVRKMILKESLRTAAAIIVVLLISHFYQSVNKKSANTPVSMNTIVVPAGQYVQLTLSDSTKIWLNALTTLKYPAAFSSKERRIFLDGEAYLQVHKDKNRTFIVETEKYQTEVLGTEFNIQAYSKNGGFETSLLEGQVELFQKSNTDYKVILQPTERAYEKDGRLYVDKITNYDSFRWKEGLLCIKNKSFEEVMSEFEKYFGSKIIIENKKVLGRTYTGKFRHGDGLEHSLRVLQKDINFITYERDDEQNIIYIK